jgi:hypothetical protein
MRNSKDERAHRGHERAPRHRVTGTVTGHGLVGAPRC